MDNIYLARQPILSRDEKLYAYEILYLDSNKQSNPENDRFASASVINSILNKFGTREFLSEHKAFVKVDEKFLLSDLILTIPADFFALSLFEDIPMSERVVERIEQLHVKKFSIAINDIDFKQEHLVKYKEVLDKIDYVKINFTQENTPKELISELHKHDIKIIATKIEDLAEYKHAKELGCDFFQGYWFSKPKILENAKIDPSQFNVLKLYNMLMEDRNIDEITSAFEENHALTLQLLQFINSGAFHFRNPISSIHHVLTLVGRKPLAQWLMLMIYSKSVSKNDNVSPLMLMVKNRTELMQNLLKALKPNVKSNALGEAYLVGVLSLIDTIFGAELKDILENMHISDIAKKALLDDSGTLGLIYKLVRDIEDFNITGIMAFSKRYKLQEDKLQKIILSSIEDVNSFEETLNKAN